MRIGFTARHLLVLTWPVEPGRVWRDLPPGVEAAVDDDGRAAVSLVALERTGVRIGDAPAPSFSELLVRTYVERPSPGSFVLAFRVTPGGLGGALAGMPYRPARIRVEEGRAEAPGLGVSARYRVTDARAELPFPTGDVPGRETVYFAAAGLRRISVEYDPVDWVEVELDGDVRADPVLALGFDVGSTPAAIYASETRGATTLPPERVA